MSAQQKINAASVKAKKLEMTIMPMQKAALAQEILGDVIEIMGTQQKEIESLKDQLWKQEQS